MCILLSVDLCLLLKRTTLPRSTRSFSRKLCSKIVQMCVWREIRTVRWTTPDNNKFHAKANELDWGRTKKGHFWDPQQVLQRFKSLTRWVRFDAWWDFPKLFCFSDKSNQITRVSKPCPNQNPYPFGTIRSLFRRKLSSKSSSLTLIYGQSRPDLFTTASRWNWISEKVKLETFCFCFFFLHFRLGSIR